MTAATISVFTYDERPYLSLIRCLLRELAEHNDWTLWFSAKDALISRARSQLASRYHDQGVGDVLVMIDQDIAWNPGDLNHLVETCARTEGVVGGIYALRDFGRGFAVRFKEGSNVVVGGNDEVVEADYVATGFMAIHRKALDRLALEMPRTIHGYRAFFATELVDHPAGIGVEYLSEDYAFARRCNRAGIPVHADLLPELEHHGMYAYRQIDGILTIPPRQSVKISSVSPTLKVPLGEGHEVLLQSSDRIISAEVRRSGHWDKPVVDELLAHPGGVLWDVGAHVGTVTVQVAGAFDRVIAWEPVPDTFEYLLKNTETIPNVTPINKALVTEETGPARMFWDYENPGASHLLHDQPGGLAVAGLNVSDALDQEGIPDALKLDIEGDELTLLRADPRLLTVPVIVLEYCDAQIRRQTGQPGSALLALLYDAGYEIAWAGRHDANLDDLPRGNAYTNLIAIRRAA